MFERHHFFWIALYLDANGLLVSMGLILLLGAYYERSPGVAIALLVLASVSAYVWYDAIRRKFAWLRSDTACGLARALKLSIAAAGLTLLGVTSYFVLGVHSWR